MKRCQLVVWQREGISVVSPVAPLYFPLPAHFGFVILWEIHAPLPRLGSVGKDQHGLMAGLPGHFTLFNSEILPRYLVTVWIRHMDDKPASKPGQAWVLGSNSWLLRSQQVLGISDIAPHAVASVICCHLMTANHLWRCLVTLLLRNKTSRRCVFGAALSAGRGCMGGALSSLLRDLYFMSWSHQIGKKKW